MGLISSILRARTARIELVASLQRVREAQKTLDAAHARVIHAQEQVQIMRGSRAIPDPDALEESDIELICAVDDWLHVRGQIQTPLEEVRQILGDYEDSIRVIQSRRNLAKSLFIKSARFTLPEQVAQTTTALTAISRILNSRLTKRTLTALARHRSDPNETLMRYRRNNAFLVATLEHFQNQLSEKPQDSGVAGGLPTEIASQVETTQLLQGAFTSILRRYQEFGARYIIKQKKIILGDEMGLGKTVQALAAICHAHALGARNFLVIAPNSVLINWEREIVAHTSLTPIVLHGALREERVSEWINSGRVGITTYGTVSKIVDLIESVDVLIVDEAHHVKNPDSLRTGAVQKVIALSDQVVLMTGTALENRLEEFKSLVGLVHIELSNSLESISTYRAPDPEVVKTMLAPVYLRRTQQDVLTELPERIHIDEWVDLTDNDREQYLHVDPNLMKKRLAATIGDISQTSAKYSRLLEVVQQHQESKQKIVVFSYFLQVIDHVSQLLDSQFIITGASTPTERQRIIDSFSQAPAGAVLISQIEAGGIGINLQMAQVVVLMEPQYKPSTEWQAIARVHRMGQSRPIVVHRLLARDTVDEHLVALINAKEQQFYAYAHDSSIKHESRMATDTRSSTIATQLQKMLDDGDIQ